MIRTITLFAFLFLVACSEEEKALPILGETSIDPATGEVVYYQAPTFALTNQLNQTITNQDFNHKIQVVDFFFTSCPTICPRMTSHLKEVEKSFAHEKEVALISFSIDSRNDTPERLLAYAERYEMDNHKWSLLTGDSDQIFDLAKDYKVRAFDEGEGDSEHNLIHDGTFVLVDGERRIRGYYNGLEVADTQRLMEDISRLLNE